MCEQRAGTEYSRVQTSCADECLLLPAFPVPGLALRQESKYASGQFPVCWIPIQCASEHSRAVSPGMLTGVSVGAELCVCGETWAGSVHCWQCQLWSVDSVQHDGEVKAAGSFVELLSSSRWKIEIQQVCSKFQR